MVSTTDLLTFLCLTLMSSHVFLNTGTTSTNRPRKMNTAKTVATDSPEGCGASAHRFDAELHGARKGMMKSSEVLVVFQRSGPLACESLWRLSAVASALISSLINIIPTGLNLPESGSRTRSRTSSRRPYLTVYNTFTRHRCAS